MHRYWPYDETTFEALDPAQGKFRILTPWLITNIEVTPQSKECEALLDISAHRESPNPEHMLTISKILSQLAKYPIAYQLPRHHAFGSDDHKTQPLPAETPEQLVHAIGLQNTQKLPAHWLWDHSAMLDFARCTPPEVTPLYDPLCLLSIARRFHHLDCEDDKIGELYGKIKILPEEKDRTAASAIIVRQNHYVTVMCQQSLTPALLIAQSQKPMLQEFMEEEKGHDSILAKGLQAMGLKAEDVPATLAVQNLMKTFEFTARTHFLAFCLSLDFFEKPEFKDTDSLAEVLGDLKQETAARALQAHKNINDHGEHDGFSAQLLEKMKPVDATYALQAIRMAELVSYYIAQVPHDLDQMIFKDRS